MELTSSRLIFVKMKSHDFHYYLQLNTNEEVMRHITGRALSESEAKTRFENNLRINNEHPETMGFFIVKEKSTDHLIGLAKFTFLNDSQAEIGYSVLPAYWGKNIATEIVAFFTDYARNIPEIKELIGIVEPDHPASIRVLTKNNYTFYRNALKEKTNVVHYRYIL